MEVSGWREREGETQLFGFARLGMWKWRQASRKDAMGSTGAKTAFRVALTAFGLVGGDSLAPSGLPGGLSAQAAPTRSIGTCRRDLLFPAIQRWSAVFVMSTQIASQMYICYSKDSLSRYSLAFCKKNPRPSRISIECRFWRGSREHASVRGSRNRTRVETYCFPTDWVMLCLEMCVTRAFVARQVNNVGFVSSKRILLLRPSISLSNLSLSVRDCCPHKSS